MQLRDAQRVGWRGVAVAALTVTLAACGGGSSSVSKRQQPTTSSSSTTSTTGSGSTTTTRASGTPACTTQQLGVSFARVGAGAGNRDTRVILTNHGAACSTIGYVGMQLLGPGGQRIPTTVVRDGPGTPTAIVVAPGGQASGTVHWGAIPGTGDNQSGDCQPNPSQVQVTPPNQVLALTTGWANGPVCEQGRIDVGPLVLGVPPS